MPAETAPPPVPVLIVGAGPTGLVLALWLTRRGVPVRIIDQAAKAGTTSRALAVQVRTLEFYQQLGIADLVVAGGVEVSRISLWVRGKRRAQLPVFQIGEGLSRFPFALVFPQDAHEQLLVEQLQQAGVTVERNTELLHFEVLGDRVRAVLKAAGREASCDATYLAGCDGAHSVVREQLHIGFPGGTYSHLFYVADVDAQGPAVDGNLDIALDEADFLILFPLRGEGRVRLVGAIRHEHDAERQLAFADVDQRIIRELDLTIHRINWFSSYRVHHRVADHFQDRRAFLLGDAAHIHSPVGGQGMNTGIGDAVNLAWKLAAVLQGHATPELLDSYEPERIGFARQLVATTDRAFTLVTREGRLARYVRTIVAPRVLPAVFRVRRFRRWMFRTVSQVGIDYRDSALSQGRTGRIRAGDRLPWLVTTDDHDNFEPLRSLEWQVHVYGTPRAELAATCRQSGIALHRFDWTDAMRGVGLLRDATYLLRPDGHVGLADPSGSAAALQSYLATHAITATA